MINRDHGFIKLTIKTKFTMKQNRVSISYSYNADCYYLIETRWIIPEKKYHLKSEQTEHMFYTNHNTLPIAQ